MVAFRYTTLMHLQQSAVNPKGTSIQVARHFTSTFFTIGFALMIHPTLVWGGFVEHGRIEPGGTRGKCALITS
jgi:hypothetical protein